MKRRDFLKGVTLFSTLSPFMGFTKPTANKIKFQDLFYSSYEGNLNYFGLVPQTMLHDGIIGKIIKDGKTSKRLGYYLGTYPTDSTSDICLEIKESYTNSELSEIIEKVNCYIEKYTDFYISSRGVEFHFFKRDDKFLYLQFNANFKKMS